MGCWGRRRGGETRTIHFLEFRNLELQPFVENFCLAATLRPACFVLPSQINHSKLIAMKLKATALFIILSILACKDDDVNSLCNCSDVSTTTSFTVGAGKIYAPNIFTPNGDGLNDVFLAFSNDGIESISLKITDRNGTVLVEYNNIQPNDPSLGWPQILDSPFDGIIKYSITALSTDGMTGTFEGTAFSKTGYFSEPPADWEGCDNCRFAAQHDGMGGFCETCSPFETICQ